MALETYDILQRLPQQTSLLCALAAEFGIEPEFVTELTRLTTFPTPRMLPGKRWPISVHTLGRFEILTGGQPLRFVGKAQRRPLALLKALIAMGGSDVPEDRVIDIVWAESLRGGDRNLLAVTLHRLRKLLGHDKALRVNNRCVSLNRDIVWVDVWALERQLEAVIPMARAVVPNAAQLEAAAPAILDLYRGRFFDGEADAAWLLPLRNRLNGRFTRVVMRLGDYWEAAGHWGRAAELYERAVEIDPLAEAFYCRLMVCLREQGHCSEAIEVFRRCRQMLSVTLGVQPAETTEAVYRGLIGSRQAAESG